MLLNTLFLKGIYTTTSSILLLFGQVIWNRIPLKHSAFYFTPSKALNLKVVLSLPKTAKLVYGKKNGSEPYKAPLLNGQPRQIQSSAPCVFE